MDTTRRGFLRGRLDGGTQPIRPPWSLSESLFIESCTRCGDCIKSCESDVLKIGDGGFPEFHADSKGCNFCEKCVQSCKTGALSFATSDVPWTVKALIGTSCLARQKVICRTCGERCETSAIRFHLQKGGVSFPQIDLANCNGCGMCVADCPTHSITLHPIEMVEESLL